MFMRLLLLFMLISILPTAAQNCCFRNNITYPQSTYIMTGVDNEIFFQPILKRWRPYNYYLRVDKTNGLIAQTSKKIVLNKPVDGDTITFNLFEGDEFDVLRTCKSVIKVGTPGVAEDSVKILFLGDSYTKGEYFKWAFLGSGYVPKVKLVGTRSVVGSSFHSHEGRGGWTLPRYFSNQPRNEYFYNPFWQPDGEYRYWGSTAFWKNCIYVRDNSVQDFNLNYNCSGYKLDGFSNDGKRINPKINDLMWDSSLESYVRWNGNSWVKFDADKLSWHFDFGKYLEMHKLDRPDYLIVMLGLNDFANGRNIVPNFTDWNSMVEELFTSYKKTVPYGCLVLSTPCSSFGILDNKSGDFTIKKNAIMWEVRKNIIEKFDSREDEGLYVVDASSSIDNENGYNIVDGIQVGNPHPYPNYPKLGLQLAAFVQYHRNISDR